MLGKYLNKARVADRVRIKHRRDGVGKVLGLEAFHLLVLAVALKTLGSAHVNHPALHLGGHHSPRMLMACFVYVC